MTGHQYSSTLDGTDQDELTALTGETAPDTVGTRGRAEANSAQRVPIGTLAVGDGPRFTGEDVAHTRLLSEVVDDLPPIVVHRSTMQVIDGVHRLRAMHLAGRDSVRVEFFDGSEDSAFVRAVEANVRHGLPLSVAERRAAAVRIMSSHPDWSDRRIAAVAGLSARTVADIRSSSDSVREADEVRLGRDGRARPLEAADGRRLAGRLIAARPEASLREIAKDAGISPETVRDVRQRLARGEDPVPQSRRGKPARTRRDVSYERVRPGRVVERIPNGPASHDRQAAIVQALRRDPSLRLSESGRLLLRWLEVSLSAAREWDRILGAVPSHRTQQMADLAKSFAEDWGRLADQVGSRTAPDRTARDQSTPDRTAPEQTTPDRTPESTAVTPLASRGVQLRKSAVGHPPSAEADIGLV
ncbi:ParB N-terminal domain-containing protein [Streptomyces sp. NPDC026294]|uniref:ParB N-terminal domain-containing protein n=1 Tax=Streptomyces sp. NPDC026294 TaxID=3155362 RepID=UPI0034069A12